MSESNKIELNEEEYETLVKLIYLGSWMVETYNEGDQNSDYYRLEQKILSSSKNFDCEDIIEADEDGNLSVDEEFEETSGLFDVIEEYNKEAFWDELSSRLAARDFENEYGDKKNQMTDDEIAGILEEKSEKYNKVFEEKGIDSISLS